MMRYIGLLLLLRATYARSPIGYDAVVVLVAIELFFAFAVGITCILFSLNMFRALNRSPEVYRSLPIGDFPLPLHGCSTPQQGWLVVCLVIHISDSEEDEWDQNGSSWYYVLRIYVT